MKNSKVPNVTYKIIRPIVSPFLGLIFHLKSEKAPFVEGPCIIVSNHNTDLDPGFIARSFKEPMYFLTSEHVMSWGFVSRLMEFLGDPVSRLKSTKDAQAAREVLRRLKEGHRICIFAEGNRSFNGVTGPIAEATGKLVKAGGATLMTYHFEGGYLTSPRWSRTMRKGRMKGYLKGVYPFSDLKDKTVDEINRMIKEDLHEDAYERQRTEHVRFKGKNLAEWLEIALYMCPECERIGNMKSSNNRFYCEACSFETHIDEYGYFDKASPFKTITEWDLWQTKKMKELQKYDLQDDEQELYKADPHNHERNLLYKGTLLANEEGMTMGDYHFAFKDMVNMNINGRMMITFFVDQNHYEIRSGHPRSGRKYLAVYQIMRERERPEYNRGE